MKIKERYIAKTLISYSLTVLIVWLSIYGFFNFLTELNSVGIEDYTILKAFNYIVLQMPGVAYDQASPIILLGCILGMGHLATTNQLIIFQTSGISILKITWLAVKNALIFIIFFISLGEFIAPYLNNYADNSRSIALGQSNLSKNQDGFWIRDGNNFINVENNVNGSLFNKVTVIELNKLNRIDKVIESKSATFDGKSLNLNEANIFSINSSSIFENIISNEHNSYKKQVAFDQDLIDSIEKEPKDLPTMTLIKQIQFLTENKLKALIFEVELYKRLVKPLTLIAMILLAMLFIFGSTRDTSLGRKIFFGLTIGLSFELISRIGGAIALSFNYSPLLSSLVPSLVTMLIALTIIIKKSTN